VINAQTRTKFVLRYFPLVHGQDLTGGSHIHIRRQAVISALGSAATRQKGGSYAKSLRRRLDVGFPCYTAVASKPVGERRRTGQSITNGPCL
jgi:hypothetical protein